MQPLYPRRLIICFSLILALAITGHAIAAKQSTCDPWQVTLAPLYDLDRLDPTDPLSENPTVVFSQGITRDFCGTYDYYDDFYDWLPEEHLGYPDEYPEDFVTAINGKLCNCAGKWNFFNRARAPLAEVYVVLPGHDLVCGNEDDVIVDASENHGMGVFINRGKQNSESAGELESFVISLVDIEGKQYASDPIPFPRDASGNRQTPCTEEDYGVVHLHADAVRIYSINGSKKGVKYVGTISVGDLIYNLQQP